MYGHGHKHRCAQAKILDRGHKDEKIKGVIKNSFRGGLEGGQNHQKLEKYMGWG